MSAPERGGGVLGPQAYSASDAMIDAPPSSVAPASSSSGAGVSASSVASASASVDAASALAVGALSASALGAGVGVAGGSGGSGAAPMTSAQIGAAVAAAASASRVTRLEDVLDDSDPRIRREVVEMIVQYLQSEGFGTSAAVLVDEADVKRLKEQRQDESRGAVKKAILNGEWDTVEKFLEKTQFKQRKPFLYAVYRQRFLELLERNESQAAFELLVRRIKPLEAFQREPHEFRELCYLLTCKSVHESDMFKQWDGARGVSRRLLVEQFVSLLDIDRAGLDRESERPLPSDRLMRLIRQACAHQVESTRYVPHVTPRITTLLEDYEPLVVPKRVQRDNVKCVHFVGEQGELLASGSSDKTVMLWSPATGERLQRLSGHTSRIWDLASSSSGRVVASASGDSTVKLWDVRAASAPCMSTIHAHDNDVYSVAFHPDQDHIVSGGYDHTVRLVDVRTAQLLRTFGGHTSAVSSVVCTRHGNMIVSGSKDSTIRFWDVVSGLCVRTIASYLGEVTSVQLSADGLRLLTASKDNSYRLWDLRAARPLRRFKGHQNTSKNFLRASFGPKESLVLGGSEDGLIYIWDADSGEVIQRLSGHQSVVYMSAWHAKTGLVASCSEDATVRLWMYDAGRAPALTPASATDVL